MPSILTSKVIIRNRSNLILNVALEHLGPVYFKNHLKPGEEVTFTVVKFWYVIHIRMSSNKSSKFSRRQNLEKVFQLVLPFINPVNGLIKLTSYYLSKTWSDPTKYQSKIPLLMGSDRSFVVSGGPSFDHVAYDSNYEYSQWVHYSPFILSASFIKSSYIHREEKNNRPTLNLRIDESIQ